MVVVERGAGWGLGYVNFELSLEGGYQNQTSACNGGRGSKFWSFCENVIIKWPLMVINDNEICSLITFRNFS